MIAGAAMTEEFMDVYISLLAKSFDRTMKPFFLFPSTFASISLFSLTASTLPIWAVEPEEALDNYIKFFPTWNTEKLLDSKFFLWPYCLDNVWILLCLKEEEEIFAFEFYHPLGQSMYNFMYVMR